MSINDELSTDERVQREHYEAIAAEYEAHYSDPSSQAYRTRFINGPMFDGIELRGKRVLDAMCGGGQATSYLHTQGCELVGLDLSPSQIEAYKKRWPNCEAHCASILKSGLPANSFDVVVITGGLHHIHPHLYAAVDEIHRVLKPGGYFCFMEPHAESLPDIARKIWYRHDGLFAENEASVDVTDLQRRYGDRFIFEKTEFGGNLAFLLVFNSMVFRVPVAAKPYYSPLLLRAEAAIKKLQSKRTSCMVVARWQKR